MIASLKKVVSRLVFLVVLVVGVHLLEDYVPLCRCLANAVRSTDLYQRVAPALAEIDPGAAAVEAGAVVRRFLSNPPAPQEAADAVLPPEHRARLRTTAERAARWVQHETLPPSMTEPAE